MVLIMPSKVQVPTLGGDPSMVMRQKQLLDTGSHLRKRCPRGQAGTGSG